MIWSVTDSEWVLEMAFVIKRPAVSWTTSSVLWFLLCRQNHAFSCCILGRWCHNHLVFRSVWSSHDLTPFPFLSLQYSPNMTMSVWFLRVLSFYLGFSSFVFVFKPPPFLLDPVPSSRRPTPGTLAFSAQPSGMPHEQRTHMKVAHPSLCKMASGNRKQPQSHRKSLLTESPCLPDFLSGSGH